MPYLNVGSLCIGAVSVKGQVTAAAPAHRREERPTNAPSIGTLRIGNISVPHPPINPPPKDKRP